MGVKVFNWGMFILLLGLLISQVVYYFPKISSLRDVSFFFILEGLVLLFVYMIHDIKQETKSYVWAIVLVLSLLVLYFLQRKVLNRYDFMLADSSYYYLDGLNSVLNHSTSGFFLPFTSSVVAIGFFIFGYEYAPLMIVIVYAASIPLVYFILRTLKVHVLLSFFMILLAISAPLSIWYAKSTFTEALWQILLLFSVVLVYQLSLSKTLHKKEMFALFMVMILAPYTRGEGSLLYGLVLFLALYHFWKFQNVRASLMIMFSSFFIAFGVHLTIQIRSHYLLKWQYARMIPDVTQWQLMGILYGVSLFFLLLVLFLNKFKNIYTKLKLPLILTVLAILFKVGFAYVIAIKKSHELHKILFTEGLGFKNLLFGNEYGFALNNFGLPLTVLIIIGMLLLYIKSLRGNFMALSLVVLYTIFLIPFVMQATTFQDVEEIFLYWNRYYFSIIMIIHIFAIGLVIQVVYAYMGRYIVKPMYKNSVFAVGLFLVLFTSMDSKMYHIVTSEAYLSNSHKLAPWVLEKVNYAPIAVVYDEHITYKRHHDRVYDGKTIVRYTLSTLHINVKSYQKVLLDDFTPTLKFVPDISRNKFLLVLSTENKHLENKQLTRLDTIVLPISWREHFGVLPEDKKIHHGDVTKSVKNSFTLYATLYRIKPKF